MHRRPEPAVEVGGGRLLAHDRRPVDRRAGSEVGAIDDGERSQLAAGERPGLHGLVRARAVAVPPYGGGRHGAVLQRGGRERAHTDDLELLVEDRVEGLLGLFDEASGYRLAIAFASASWRWPRARTHSPLSGRPEIH